MGMKENHYCFIGPDGELWGCYESYLENFHKVMEEYREESKNKCRLSYKGATDDEEVYYMSGPYGEVYRVREDDAEDFREWVIKVCDRIRKCVFAYNGAKENENVLYLTGNYDEIYRVREEEAAEFRTWQAEIKKQFDNKEKMDFYDEQ